MFEKVIYSGIWNPYWISQNLKVKFSHYYKSSSLILKFERICATSYFSSDLHIDSSIYTKLYPSNIVEFFKFSFKKNQLISPKTFRRAHANLYIGAQVSRVARKPLIKYVPRLVNLMKYASKDPRRATVGPSDYSGNIRFWISSRWYIYIYLSIHIHYNIQEQTPTLAPIRVNRETIHPCLVQKLFRNFIPDTLQFERLWQPILYRVYAIPFPNWALIWIFSRVSPIPLSRSPGPFFTPSFLPRPHPPRFIHLIVYRKLAIFALWIKMLI